MKSKICWCNGTILKKDLTRFMPLMLLECFILLLVGYSYHVTKLGENYIEEPSMIFGIFAVVLAFFSAVTVFSYLTKKKECDAMHTLPVRRETLLVTHSLAALIQFAVPFAVLYIFLPGTKGWAWQMGLSLGHWLFTFGSVTVCMMLAGTRLGGVLLYWLAGNLPNMIYTAISVLYIPLLPGFYLEPAESLELSPWGLLAELIALGELDRWEWLAMAVYGLAGVALLGLALLIYRKRKLERAGDFLTVKWLEPVFAWGVAITLTCSLVTLGRALDTSDWVTMTLGLTVGYFGARMLFARSVRVFEKKNLLGYALLLAVVLGSVGVVSADPLNAVARVPAGSEIKTVTISDNNIYRNLSNAQGGYTAQDPDEVDGIRTIHQMLVDAGAVSSKPGMDYYYYYGSNERFYLTYELKNGATVKRAYIVEHQYILDRIAYYLSQPENLVGTADLEVLLDRADDLHVWAASAGNSKIHNYRGFFRAFLADCEAGNMYAVDSAMESAWNVVFYLNVDGERQYVDIDIPHKAKNTVAWLEENFLIH